MMTTPWPPTDYASSPVVVLEKVPSIQIDFVRGIHNDTFIDSEDCLVVGQDGFLIGFKVCLAKSQSTPGSLFAGLLEIALPVQVLTSLGIFVCTQGVVDNECWTAS